MDDCRVHHIPKEDILEALTQAVAEGEKFKELLKAAHCDGGKEIRLPLNFRDNERTFSTKP